MSSRNVTGIKHATQSLVAFCYGSILIRCEDDRMILEKINYSNKVERYKTRMHTYFSLQI